MRTERLGPKFWFAVTGPFKLKTIVVTGVLTVTGHDRQRPERRHRRDRSATATRSGSEPGGTGSHLEPYQNKPTNQPQKQTQRIHTRAAFQVGRG